MVLSCEGLLRVSDRLLIVSLPAEVDRPAPQKLSALGGFPASIDPLAQLIDHRWGRPQLGVAFTSSIDRDTVERALRDAHANHLGVELFGAVPPSDARPLPPLFQHLAEAMVPPAQVLPLEALFLDEVCDECVGTASLDGDGLLVTNGARHERWTEVRLRPLTEPPPLLDFARTGGVPELLEAAQLALTNDHLLAVRVAR